MLEFRRPSGQAAQPERKKCGPLVWLRPWAGHLATVVIVDVAWLLLPGDKRQHLQQVLTDHAFEAWMIGGVMLLALLWPLFPDWYRRSAQPSETRPLRVALLLVIVLCAVVVSVAVSAELELPEYMIPGMVFAAYFLGFSVAQSLSALLGWAARSRRTPRTPGEPPVGDGC